MGRPDAGADPGRRAAGVLGVGRKRLRPCRNLRQRLEDRGQAYVRVIPRREPFGRGGKSVKGKAIHATLAENDWQRQCQEPGPARVRIAVGVGWYAPERRPDRAAGVLPAVPTFRHGPLPRDRLLSQGNRIMQVSRGSRT